MNNFDCEMNRAFRATYLTRAVLETNRIADFISQIGTYFISYSFGNRHGCYTSRLGTPNHTKSKGKKYNTLNKKHCSGYLIITKVQGNVTLT